MKRTALTILAAASLLASSAFAAETTTTAQKPLSPPASTSSTIGGANITIDYSAPSKRNRAIIGGLVPYGQVWRTGANAATTLKTTRDIRIGDLDVPAGTYTLYTIPAEKNWTLIVNKQTGQWGTKYDATQDLGRTTLSIAPVKDTVETFAIDVKPSGAKSGALTLTWENTQASAPIVVK